MILYLDSSCSSEKEFQYVPVGIRPLDWIWSNDTKWYQRYQCKKSRPQDDFSPLKSPKQIFLVSVVCFRENPMGIFPGVSLDLKKVGLSIHLRQWHPLTRLADEFHWGTGLAGATQPWFLGLVLNTRVFVAFCRCSKCSFCCLWDVSCL